MTDFISKEEVLLILKEKNASDEIIVAVSNLFSFPSPNPDWQNNDRTDQTNDEFWAAVERQDKDG